MSEPALQSSSTNNSRNIPQKLRFEVFKRDFFQCVYCGRNPPVVILQADHVIPFSKGGRTSIENLVTSCFECNVGKSNRDLTSIPESLNSTIKKTREREEQVLAYGDLLASIEIRKDRETFRVFCVFYDAFPGGTISAFLISSIKNTFLSKLPVQVLIEAAEIACAKKYTSYSAGKYFYGICRNKIREHGEFQ